MNSYRVLLTYRTSNYNSSHSPSSHQLTLKRHTAAGSMGNVFVMTPKTCEHRAREGMNKNK